MPEVLMREVVCQNCSLRTTQRLSALEPILWLQAISSEDGIYINYACPACSKLTRSRVASGAKTVHETDATKSGDDLAVYLVFLKCSKKSCESAIILFAPVDTLREADFVAHIRENWKTGGAGCAKGHPPAHPYEFRIWKQIASEP
jgi:hypothetical protein